MKLEIRNPNLEIKNKEGIPLDFIGVMNLFNKLLEKGELKFNPRKIKITSNEIKTLWLPSAKENMNYVAVLNGKVVASGTLLINKKSNKYSIKSGRFKENAEYSIIFDKNFKNVAKKITRKIIAEAKKIKLNFSTHVSIENKEEIRFYKELGYKPTRKIKKHPRYISAGLNPTIWEYLF